MHPVWLVAGLGLCVAGAPALAEGPSFDCARAEGSVQTLICADAELAAHDRRLARRYADALDLLRSLPDMRPPTAVLKATQRGWIKGRDDCWKAEDLRACVEDAYLTRDAQLVATYMLLKPTSWTRWACGGNPAQEVVAFTYDSARPSIRLEYGDSIDAGVQVPAASGTRYAASFGRSFWIKGETALLEWPEGTLVECLRQGPPT